jgi:hypothetical protein
MKKQLLLALLAFATVLQVACDDPKKETNETETMCDEATDADCDGVTTDLDCDDSDAENTSTNEGDADCDGVATDLDCDDSDAMNTSTNEGDADCDGVATDLDCDDSDAMNTSTNEGDADCDGVATDLDCDDNDAMSSIKETDADCDGVATDLDCDDSDAMNTSTNEGDADCDGVATDLDCDDSDAEDTRSNENDADCDDVTTDLDCDDSDAEDTRSNENDADCDDIPTEDDCDDSNPESTRIADDADCDGTITAEDCDDEDDSSTIISEDTDCDGLVNTVDVCPEDPDASQLDPDGDGFGSDCGDDESDFVKAAFNGYAACDSNDDCPVDEFCLEHPGADENTYCFPAEVTDTACTDGSECTMEDGQCNNEVCVVPHWKDCINDDLCLTRDPWGGPLHNTADDDPESGSEYDNYDANRSLYVDWSMGSAGVSAYYTGIHGYGGNYWLEEQSTRDWMPWVDELFTWDGAILWGQVRGQDLSIRTTLAPEECPEGEVCPDPEYHYHNVMITQWTQGTGPGYITRTPGNRRPRSGNPLRCFESQSGEYRCVDANGGREYARARMVEFEKEGFADPIESADCITKSVCIGRGDNQSLYNTLVEEGYDANTSVAGTRWARGATRYNSQDSYTSFSEMHGNNPSSLIWSDRTQRPEIVSLHVVEEDIYFDVIFTSFTNGQEGAGFSYIRSRALVPGCTTPGEVGYNPAANLEDNTCGMERFVRPDYADWGLAENQLCLSDAVCLTRANTGGLFNYIREEIDVPTELDAEQLDPRTLAIDAVESYVVASHTFNLENTNGSPWRFDAINFGCSSEGLSITPGGPNGVQYKFFAGETLDDFSRARITGELTTDRTLDPTWYVNLNSEDPNTLSGSGVILFERSWRSLSWWRDASDLDVDNYFVAVEVSDLTMLDAGVASECSYEVSTRAYREWSYDNSGDNVRWAYGKTTSGDQACDEARQDEQVMGEDCYLNTATPGGTCNDGSVDAAAASACANPAITYCGDIDASTGEGVCKYTETYLQNRFGTFMKVIPWPGPQVSLNTGNVLSLYDCSTEMFYEMRFLTWTSRGKGGGFEVAYKEAEAPSWYTSGAIHCPVSAVEDGDVMDYVDSDDDGFFDIGDQFNPADNCPYTANPDQLDGDEDGRGAACDIDDADPMVQD